MHCSTQAVLCLTIAAVARSAVGDEARWPRFRGANGRGVAESGQYPTKFGPTENVAWKAALPAGQSSPCIWDQHIFLTGYADETLETVCLDRRDGRIRWRRTAPVERMESYEGPGGPAASTPATDGERVYVYFGSFGLLCYDFDGFVQWTLPLPTPITGWGSGVSPILSDGRLFLKCDQDVGSYLLAVDAATGREVWRTRRARFRRSYGTPIVWSHEAGTELIVPGALELAAYDLGDGTERWSMHGLPADMCTTPTTGGGLLYIAAWGPGADPGRRLLLPPYDKALEQHDANRDGRLTKDEVPEGRARVDYDEVDADKNGWVSAAEWRTASNWFARTDNALLAIRPGGRGDTTDTHVVWKQTRGLPYVPSPLCYRDRIYLVKDGGIASCYDARTGSPLFQGRLGPRGRYHTSPVAGDGKLYVASRNGVVVVFEAAETLEILARNDFGEEIAATPALVDGTIYLRTKHHLYAVK